MIIQVDQCKGGPDHRTQSIHTPVKAKYAALCSRRGFIAEQGISCPRSDSFAETVKRSCQEYPQRVNEDCHHWFADSAQCITPLYKWQSFAGKIAHSTKITFTQSGYRFSNSLQYANK